MQNFANEFNERSIYDEQTLCAALPFRKETFDTTDTAFVVIDAINGFLKQGALADAKMMHIIPVIRAAYDALPTAKKFAFYDNHSEQSEEFRNFPPHCLAGSTECELVDELKPLSFQLLPKNSTNGFFRFLPYVNGFQKFLIAGDCTDLCVLQFALTLKSYLQEQNSSAEVAVIVNATDTFDAPTHPKQEMNRIAFRLLAQSGVTLLKYEENTYVGH